MKKQSRNAEFTGVILNHILFRELVGVWLLSINNLKARYRAYNSKEQHKTSLTEPNILLFIDFDECASGENDCSQWATCTNTWASYTCVCLDGFIDQSTERKPATPHKTSKTVSTTSAIPMASTTSIPKTTIITTTISPAPSTTTNVSILGAISAQCRAAAITVTVAKGFLQSANIRESTLYLGLPECGLNVRNTTHAELTVAWNECATRLVQVSFLLQLGSCSILCYALTCFNDTMLACIWSQELYVITGSGVFQVTVQLMNGTIPLPHNYSMSSEEDVVVEVSLNTSSEQIKIVISKCWATPTPNPGDTYSHTFLENSCSLNSFTKVLTNGNSSTSRLSVKIFSIVDLDVIYLHCQVQICVQMGSDTFGVDPSPTPCLLSLLVFKLDIILAESLEEEFNTLYVAGLACIGIGVSLIFIIGFVCLFYYQRNRIGHYNFSVKPKQENFTYLVFNT
uniref:Uromodulin-like 1 n=1 Tax=Labrus bergylta TaxID=56723 RepID=A0A3Q3FCS7_9LABR